MRICEDCAAFATPDAAACTECDSPHIRPLTQRERELFAMPTYRPSTTVIDQYYSDIYADGERCFDCPHCSTHVQYVHGKPMPLRECSLSLEPEACPAVREWLEAAAEEDDREH